MASGYSENTIEDYGINMRSTKIIFESGDIKVYCYIDDKLDKIAVLPTMESAVQYAADYNRI
jgi:hypothetical protein